MPNKKIFTIEQEQFIVNSYETMSTKDIVAGLGGQFTSQQVNGWLLRNGLRRHGKYNYFERVFTKEASQFVKDNYNTMRYADIAEILGVTKQQVHGKVASLGLPTKQKHNNGDYFNVIDCPLKAYFLGFIYADGWIVYNPQKSKYEFGMQLQSQDVYVLEKLNEVLGGENVIHHKEPKEFVVLNKQIGHGGHSDVLRVNSKELVCGLIKNGIVTNKTQKTDYPVVSEDLFFDFLRGYIDGDGCFFKFKNGVYMHITSATRDVLSYIQEMLKKYDIKAQVYEQGERRYRLMCTNKNSMQKLVKRLYYEDGLFCLKRKYSLVKQPLGLTA